MKIGEARRLTCMEWLEWQAKQDGRVLPPASSEAFLDLLRTGIAEGLDAVDPIQEPPVAASTEATGPLSLSDSD